MMAHGGESNIGNIVDEWCVPLSLAEIKALDSALRTKLDTKPFPWKQIVDESNFHLRSEAEAHHWLTRIHRLVLAHTAKKVAAK